jgi:hypothetical protein
VALVDGPTGTGSTILVNGNDLYVQNAGPDDAGVYDVVVFNNCGGDTSEPVTLTVIDCCAGDLDGDDSVGLADLATLLAHFGQTNGAHYADGDLDDDGDVDLSDLTELLASYGGACD